MNMKTAWILTVLFFVGLIWWIWKYRIFEKAEEYQIIPDEWNHGVQPFREPRRELTMQPQIRAYEPTSTPTQLVSTSSISPITPSMSIITPTIPTTETLLRHGIYQRTTISVLSPPTIQELIQHGGIRK